MWWRSESRFVRMPSSSWCAALLGPQMGVLKWWRWKKTAKQNTSYNEEYKTKGSLIAGLRSSTAICSFFRVGASETSKNNKVYCAIKKVHLKALGEKMNRDDTNPFLVAGSPIRPGKAASWLIQVFMQRKAKTVASGHLNWTLTLSDVHNGWPAATTLLPLSANTSVPTRELAHERLSLSFSTCWKIFHSKKTNLQNSSARISNFPCTDLLRWTSWVRDGNVKYLRSGRETAAVRLIKYF